jgi:hypothetical protein
MMFSDFIDDELSHRKAHEFRLHIAECKSCEEQLRQFTQSTRLIKLLPDQKAPSELWQKIETGVRIREGRKVLFFHLVEASHMLTSREKPLFALAYGASVGTPKWG